MEEKKLTDEQDGLLIEFDEYGFAPTITMPNAEEYAKAWKNTLIDMFQRLNFLQAEQKAEIERLTEEKSAYVKDYEFVKNEYASALITLGKEGKAKAELQKQVDELTKPINGKFKDNNALQKAYESLEKEFTRRSQKLRELQDENAVYKQAIDSEREPYHLGFEHGKEQAVKDTANKIFRQVLKLYQGLSKGEKETMTFEWKLLDLAVEYGVEVE